jgi:hypothetical protein
MGFCQPSVSWPPRTGSVRDLVLAGKINKQLTGGSVAGKINWQLTGDILVAIATLSPPVLPIARLKHRLEQITDNQMTPIYEGV